MTIYLTVLGPKNAAVPQGSEAMRVLVDDTPAQNMTIRAPDADGFVYAVLVDVSLSSAKEANLIRKAAADIFEKLSTAGTHGYLVAFNDRVAISPTALSPQQVARALDEIKFNGGTAIFDAVRNTCMTVMAPKAVPADARKIIILLSDGIDNASDITLQQAEQIAELTGVTIYTIALKTDSTYSEDRRAQEVLSGLSRKTGGWAITPRDLSQGTTLVLQAINDQWAVRFVPVQKGDGRLHKLTIKSAQNHVAISAPAQIFLP